MTDTLPAGLALVDASGSGWNCVIAGATVTCSRTDVLAQAQSYPAIQIRADVAADATSTANEATVSGGGDTTPDDNVARDAVPISPAGQPNLILTKEHDGDFTQGQQGAAYRLRVANCRPGADGRARHRDRQPSGWPDADVRVRIRLGVHDRVADSHLHAQRCARTRRRVSPDCDSRERRSECDRCRQRRDARAEEATRRRETTPRPTRRTSSRGRRIFPSPSGTPIRSSRVSRARRIRSRSRTSGRRRPPAKSSSPMWCRPG